MERLLDFLIIGAQNSGTTSLFHHLRSHPDVYMPAQKEVMFFTPERNYAHGWPAYAQRYRSSTKASSAVTGTSRARPPAKFGARRRESTPRPAHPLVAIPASNTPWNLEGLDEAVAAMVRDPMNPGVIMNGCAGSSEVFVRRRLEAESHDVRGRRRTGESLADSAPNPREATSIDAV